MPDYLKKFQVITWIQKKHGGKFKYSENPTKYTRLQESKECAQRSQKKPTRKEVICGGFSEEGIFGGIAEEITVETTYWRNLRRNMWIWNSRGTF